MVFGYAWFVASKFIKDLLRKYAILTTSYNGRSSFSQLSVVTVPTSIENHFDVNDSGILTAGQPYSWFGKFNNTIELPQAGYFTDYRRIYFKKHIASMRKRKYYHFGFI